MLTPQEIQDKVKGFLSELETVTDVNGEEIGVSFMLHCHIEKLLRSTTPLEMEVGLRIVVEDIEYGTLHVHTGFETILTTLLILIRDSNRTLYEESSAWTKISPDKISSEPQNVG